MDGYEEVEEVSLKYFIFLRFSILAMQVEQNGSFRVRKIQKQVKQSITPAGKQASMHAVGHDVSSSSMPERHATPSSMNQNQAEESQPAKWRKSDNQTTSQRYHTTPHRIKKQRKRNESPTFIFRPRISSHLNFSHLVGVSHPTIHGEKPQSLSIQWNRYDMKHPTKKSKKKLVRYVHGKTHLKGKRNL
ncbi:hypothetical protein DL95DRAFT_125722 [Leptodontidium sp. 2 PMI_412]|nr:hypothetical protein DL95DRAFT_125722 [Leptodontidium sp. 2 PMI_412]